ncbi:MAG TPA: chemotaxis protein CheW [Acidiferrobacteraceae bacterium]|nr:chemotaxis protein CheW [Acidiferrobacteraceae bacterium]
MSAANEVVHALLIPLGRWSLVIPSALIAEVVTVPELAPVPLGASWLLGVSAWRSRPLPLISFDGLLGDPEPEISRRSRMVVFYPLPGRAARDFFAVKAALEPQPTAFEDAQVFGERLPVPSALGAGFRLGSLQVVIPDLTALARQLYAAPAA